ncbi:MAG: hypothetical protein ACRD4M_01830 [Candidatus Acidiferrales bacterium]
MLAVLALASGAFAQEKKNSAGESFFMISSINQSQSQVLLKAPTELTQLVGVTAQTKYLDENNKPLKLSDLRAGDTVWVITRAEKGGDVAAISIRKGPMTVSELHQLYLDYQVLK